MSIFNFDKLSLKAKKLPNGTFPPSLKVDVYKNNPTIFVSTGMKKGEGVTYVRAGLDIKTAGLICRCIEDLADKPADSEKATTYTFECLSGREKELTAKVVVGKDKNGRMFISVINTKDNNAPIIQFYFTSDMYHPMQFSHTEDNRAMVSCLAAKEWAERTRTLLYLDAYHNPPPPPEKKGYDNNNSNRNNNSSNDISDEDLPW